MTSPSQGERFYVDIQRRYEDTYWHGRYEWQLREGELDRATVVDEYEIKTSGDTWTLWGARRAARRAKRKVMRSRSAGGRYLGREAVR